MKKIACVTLVLGIMFVSRAVFAEEGPPVVQTQEKDASVTEKTEQKSPQTLIKRVVISKDGIITIHYEAGYDAENASPPIIGVEDEIEKERKNIEQSDDSDAIKLKKFWDIIDKSGKLYEGPCPHQSWMSCTYTPQPKR